MRQKIEKFNQQFQTLTDTDNNAFRLYLVGKKLQEGKKTVYEEILPKEVIIDNSIQRWLLCTTQSMLSNLLEYDLINMQSVDEGGETIRRYLELKELSQLSHWKEVIDQDEIEEDAHPFINDENFKPQTLIATFKLNGEKIYFLKVISENVLLKTKTILNWNIARGRYELDDKTNKKIFLDDQWDGIIFYNNLVLFNENKILSLFKYYEKFREATIQVVNKATEIGLLSEETNFVKFIESQVSLQKKLARITNYSLEAVDKERIEEFINQGTISLNLDDKGRIICTTKEEAKVVVDVILDNFVTSMITNQNYRALNKARL